MNRRTGAALLAVLAIAAACTSAPELREPSRPVPGGTLRVTVRDLGTLDPARASGRGSLLAIAQIFDSLTAIDPATNDVRPGAAASWRASSDGLTWRFRLAEASYHDGKPVLAKDFEFAFDRIARRATRSDAAFQLEPIRGFRDAHVTARARTLAGVSTRGDRELVIVLARPFAELPHLLAHPALAPVPARLYGKTAAALATKPVGNGPFRVASATAERSATLVRSESYRETVLLDGIDLTVVDDIDEGWRAFTEGGTDVADVPAGAIDAARGAAPDGFTPQWATLSFGPNLRHEKYAKPEVRRALSLAIDRGAIADTVYGKTKDPATGIVPRGVRGFVPDACGTACVLDRARAKQILDAAFPRTKPRIAVDHLSDATSRLVARTLANHLSLVGLNATLRAHSPTAYLKLLQKGQHDFAQLGWLSDVPTPDGFLAQQLRTGSPNNQTGFKDATFDRLLDRARKATDERERLDAYRDAEERALELMPLIPVVFFRNRTGIAERVRGLTVDGAGLFDATTVWLARD